MARQLMAQPHPPACGGDRAPRGPELSAAVWLGAAARSLQELPAASCPPLQLGDVWARG